MSKSAQKSKIVVKANGAVKSSGRKRVVWTAAKRAEQSRKVKAAKRRARASRSGSIEQLVRAAIRNAIAKHAREVIREMA